ncbi:MAG: FAD:protein FMN transferase [Planctomycetota bacterium]
MNSGKKASRRQFLTGKAAVDALHRLHWGGGRSKGEEQEPPAARSGKQPSDPLIQIGRRAMACDFQAFCRPDRYPGAVEAASEALDLVDVLEDQMTVFREHSDIMRVNRTAYQRPCPLEFRLFELLCRCVDWYHATGGAFDITAGPLVKLWGFYTRRGRFPEPDQIEATMQRVGSCYLQLDRDQSTVRFTRGGMELNLGSVGKGYALDRCSELLEDAGVESFMIHGGQSSLLARGVRRESDESREEVPWRVAVRHPLRPERRLAELVVRDQAVGTSGSGRQFFYHRGRRYGHVLDPRNGVPAEGVLSATVLAPTAARADALATTFFVLGVDATAAYCENRPELSVVFVLPGTRKGTVAIEIIGPDDAIHLLDK